jgi:outer membrane protein assembly factor BamB
VPTTAISGWPTVNGNERRAAYENEWMPDSLDVAWDIDAGSGMRTSILFADSAVFAATTNRQLIALSVVNGHKYWEQRLDGEIASDLVRSGQLLFATTAERGGGVDARDVVRGKRVWKRAVGPARFSPLLDGGLVYVGTDAGWVHALRSEDGAVVWKIRVAGSIASTLVSHADAIIALSGSDTIYSIAKRDGAIRTKMGVSSTVSAAPALRADTLIVPLHSGAIAAFNAVTLQTLWRVDTGAPVLAAPIVTSNGSIHILNRDAQIWRIDAGRGTRIATLGGTSSSSFTVARNRYLIGKADGSLVVADMNGRVIAEHKFNDSVAAPVAVAQGALYVPLLHGRVVKLR